MYSITRTRSIAAKPETVWNVVADISRNGELADNLLYQKPEYNEIGELTGVVCANTQGASWREDVLIWEPPTHYSTEVDTTDYPYPFRKMIATNTIQPEGERTRLTVTFEFIPDYPQPVQWIMAQVSRIFMQSIIATALDNWEQEATRSVVNQG